MSNQRVYDMRFASVYSLYIAKAQRKGRTKEEVDSIILWLTGYDKSGLEPLMQEIHYLDRLNDELSKGKLWKKFFVLRY